MTTVAERETKRADQLKKGDWLAPGTATEDAPAEVLAVLPYVTDEDGPSVSVIIRDEDGKPATWELTEFTKLGLATKAEVDEHRDDARRMQLAAQLRQLAALVVSKRLPLPGRYEHSFVSFNFGRHIDQVDRVAEILGVEREVVYGSGRVKWPSSREGLLDVTWQAYAPKEEPKPEPEPVADPTGLAYTRADDEPDDPTPVSPARVPLHTGAVTDEGLVDETGPIVQHYDASAWANEFVCACGEAFGDEPALMAHVRGLVDETEALIRCGCGPTHTPDCIHGVSF